MNIPHIKLGYRIAIILPQFSDCYEGKINAHTIRRQICQLALRLEARIIHIDGFLRQPRYLDTLVVRLTPACGANVHFASLGCDST
jgi:hypothetical protein